MTIFDFRRGDSWGWCWAGHVRVRTGSLREGAAAGCALAAPAAAEGRDSWKFDLRRGRFLGLVLGGPMLRCAPRSLREGAAAGWALAAPAATEGRDS